MADPHEKQAIPSQGRPATGQPLAFGRLPGCWEHGRAGSQQSRGAASCKRGAHLQWEDCQQRRAVHVLLHDVLQHRGGALGGRLALPAQRLLIKALPLLRILLVPAAGGGGVVAAQRAQRGQGCRGQSGGQGCMHRESARERALRERSRAGRGGGMAGRLVSGRPVAGLWRGHGSRVQRQEGARAAGQGSSGVSQPGVAAPHAGAQAGDGRTKQTWRATPPSCRDMTAGPQTPHSPPPACAGCAALRHGTTAVGGKGGGGGGGVGWLVG